MGSADKSGAAAAAKLAGKLAKKLGREPTKDELNKYLAKKVCVIMWVVCAWHVCAVHQMYVRSIAAISVLVSYCVEISE